MYTVVLCVKKSTHISHVLLRRISLCIKRNTLDGTDHSSIRYVNSLSWLNKCMHGCKPKEPAKTAPCTKKSSTSHTSVRPIFRNDGAHDVKRPNEKSARRRRKHCALAVVRRIQKVSPRRRTLPGNAGRPKFNQLEMVTTFIYKPSLVKIDARNFELSW